MHLTRFQRANYRLIVAAVIVYLLLPGSTINLFYEYSSVGGSLIMKIHPGTYLIFGGFCWLLVRGGGLTVVAQNARTQLWVLQFAVAMILIAAINVIRFGTSGAAYMADTLIATPLGLIMMAYLAPTQRERLSKVILLAILVNALVAACEFVLKTNVLQHQNELGSSYFRASGFFGHPLNSALITAPMLPLLLLTNWSIVRKLVYANGYIVAVLAFGARAALGFGIATFAAAMLHACANMIIGKRMPLSAAMMVPWLTSVGAVMLASLLIATDFGDRFIARGVMDENAVVRLNSLNVLSYLTSTQLWMGIDLTDYRILLERYPDLTIIENFWINFIVSCGIPLFVVFVSSFLWFLYGLQKYQDKLIMFSIISFLLVASSNNSLSTKTAALFLFCTTTYGLRRNK